MEAGAISSSMVEEAFRLATTEGGRYNGMADKMSETAGGKWSTMMGTFQQKLAEVGLKFATWISPLFDIGTAFAENITPFVDGLIGLFQWVSNCTPLLYGLGIVALGLGVNFVIANAAAWGFAIVIGILEGAIWLVTAAQTAWNFVLNMNPVGLVVMAIAALIAIVYVCWQKFEGFRGVIMGAWEVIKNFGGAIKDYVINRFKELLSGITGIGSALLAFFSGDFKKAWEVGKKAAGDLMGVGSAKQLVKDGINAGKSFSTGYDKGVAMGPKKAQNLAPKPKGETARTKQAKSTVFDALKDQANNGDKKKKGNKAAKDKQESVVSGGAKMTHITVNIAKLQDDTKIYVENTQKGIEKLGELVQEQLLRSINSINNMQTS